MALADIFLSVWDLQELIGYSCYNSAQRKHKEIRDKMGKGNSKRLTIKDYCTFEGHDFEFIWEFLQESRKRRKTPKIL